MEARAALGITLIVASMVFALWAAFHPHSPGWSIGAFGLVAFVASLRLETAGLWEKFAWFIVLYAFLLLEFNAIKKNDEAQTAALQNQNDQFQTIIAELQDQLADEQNSTCHIAHVSGFDDRPEFGTAEK